MASEMSREQVVETLECMNHFYTDAEHYSKFHAEIMAHDAQQRAHLATLHAELEGAYVAIKALLHMAERGKPSKLVEALAWVENDQYARKLAADVLNKQPADHSMLIEEIDTLKQQLADEQKAHERTRFIMAGDYEMDMNGELRKNRDLTRQLAAREEALVKVYQHNAACAAGVAFVCDEWLDRSGKLLGDIRTKASKG